TGDGQRRRNAILARQRLVERAVDEATAVPIGGVDELSPRRVRRRVVQYEREVDDELPAGRDDGEVVEGEHVADVGERVRHQRAVVEPGGGVAHVGEIDTRGVEVVDDRDAVQVVDRPLEVDDRARGRVEQDRDRQRPREGDADGDEGRAGRIRLVD